jgi:predicted porin
VTSLGLKLSAWLVAFASLLTSAWAADLPSNQPPAPPPTLGPTSCTDPVQFFTTNCALSWYGITVYGTVDFGVGYETHGAPFNNSIITGVEELIQKNSNRALWLLTPGGLGQSIVGIKGKEDLIAGWSFVFDLSLGFDPYSMTLANGPKSFFQNNGVPLADQSSNADSSRAGQFYNGVGFAGISNETFGTLTAGRVNSLTLDGLAAYDPMSLSYAFSPLGWSGLTAGVGDTEDARYTTAVKYRVNVGIFRAAALYQWGGYDLNNGTQSAYQLQVGGTYDTGGWGKLSADFIYTNDKGAVSSAPLSAAQNLKYPGTLAATISDDQGYTFLGKWTYNQIMVSGGYELIEFQNPSDPQLTNFTDIAGYTVVAANINNKAYTNHRIQRVMWIGGRYNITENLNVGIGLYHYIQDNYALKYCNNTSLASCAGTLNAISFDVDWQFAEKFDAYAGLMYSEVHNGLASGYLNPNNLAPTAGVRFRF